MVGNIIVPHLCNRARAGLQDNVLLSCKSFFLEVNNFQILSYILNCEQWQNFAQKTNTERYQRKTSLFEAGCQGSLNVYYDNESVIHIKASENGNQGDSGFCMIGANRNLFRRICQ